MTRFAALTSGLASLLLLALAVKTWLDDKAAVTAEGVQVGAALSIGVLAGASAAALWRGKPDAPKAKE